MNEEGTTYRTKIRKTSVKIEQTEDGDFELFLSDKSKGRFSTANSAREKIIRVIVETTGEDESAIRNEVPLLDGWMISRTAPFDPEQK